MNLAEKMKAAADNGFIVRFGTIVRFDDAMYCLTVTQIQQLPHDGVMIALVDKSVPLQHDVDEQWLVQSIDECIAELERRRETMQQAGETEE